MKDSSKDTTERTCEGQHNDEELTVESPSVIIVNDSNNVPSSEMNTADELKSTTLYNSKGGDINRKNNISQQDRGSLSLIGSNGVDDPSLRLPYGIGLDCSPCGKRAASSTDADESDLQKSHSITAKRMRTLSLSDEVVKDRIGTRFEDVTHHVRNVTQDGAPEGLAANERNEDSNNVKPDVANVSRYEMTDLLVRKEFSLSDTEDDTQLNSTDAARETIVENNREVPITPQGEEVQLEEFGEGKVRQTNEGIGKGNSSQSCEGRKLRS